MTNELVRLLARATISKSDELSDTELTLITVLIYFIFSFRSFDRIIRLVENNNRESIEKDTLFKDMSIHR